MTSFKKYIEGDPKRLKMLVFGGTGTGKTITALQMPDPAVIDTERGCDWYMEKFPDAGFNQTTDPEEIRASIKEIAEDPNGFKTLVIDSFTLYQEAIEERQLNKRRTEKQNPHYTFGPIDYKYMKNSVRSIVHDLLSVDMNVVCTAKAKAVYDSSGDDFMGKIIGYEPDVRKEVPHYFDTVVELQLRDDGTRVAIVHKDRTNTLPREIENYDYAKLVEYFGEEDLKREPIVFKSKIEADQRRNRNTEIELDGKTLNTAGVTAETLKSLIKIKEEVGISNEKLVEKLISDYGQDALTSLREDEARLLLKDLNGEIG